MEPPFQSAVSWFPIGPGERRYGGPLDLSPSPDGTGGALWYVSASDDVRSWPPVPDDAPLEPAPWPIDAHVVVPVSDD